MALAQSVRRLRIGATRAPQIMRLTKAALALCLFASTSAAAAAKLAEPEPEPRPSVTQSWSIDVGPAAATLDDRYFRSPYGVFAAQPIVPCRLDRSTIAGEVHLAYSCH